MSFYSTETELVRDLASRFRRAASVAKDIAGEAADGLAIAALTSSVVTDALLLAERLDRASTELANYSLDVDESERSNQFEKIENRMGLSWRTSE